MAAVWRLLIHAAFVLLLYSTHPVGSLRPMRSPEGFIIGNGPPITLADHGEVLWHGEKIQLSWKPRLFYLKNFLSKEECEHLIEVGEPKLEPSVIVTDDGRVVTSNFRSSQGGWLPRNGDEVIKAVERRIAALSMLPEDHQEQLYILRYQENEKYGPHHDYFADNNTARAERGGQRMVTVLMYLSTPEGGGETVFPYAHEHHFPKGPQWSDCALGGMGIKPKRGDAVMFYGLDADGTPDPSSIHESCPVVAGVKWSATKWIRQLPQPR